MSVAFKQLRVYLRGAVVLIVVVGIGLVLVNNRHHEVTVWFFGLTDVTKPVNVVYLMLCTAAGTLIGGWTLSLVRGLRRDIREVRRQRAVDQMTKALDERAVALEDRERRVDEKLKQAIGEDSETGDE